MFVFIIEGLSWDNMIKIGFKFGWRVFVILWFWYLLLLFCCSCKVVDWSFCKRKGCKVGNLYILNEDEDWVMNILFFK